MISRSNPRSPTAACRKDFPLRTANAILENESLFPARGNRLLLCRAEPVIFYHLQMCQKRGGEAALRSIRRHATPPPGKWCLDVIWKAPCR